MEGEYRLEDSGSGNFSKLLEECLKRRYRHSVIKYGGEIAFVWAMMNMLRKGLLPDEITQKFQKEDMEVEVKDTKTIYNYVSDILDMYPEIKEEFYKALKIRIENKELPKSKTSFWKGRFLEDLVYETLIGNLEERYRIGENVIVLPIYKIRTRPGNGDENRRGRKSDADKIADILIIDWSQETLIVIELKNFWEYYSGKYDVEEQAQKLLMTVSKEGIDMIMSRIHKGRIPGKRAREINENPLKIVWEVLCEKPEPEFYKTISVEALKYLSLARFRKVYIWFHAGEQVDMLKEKLNEFEKRNGIEILRVFVNKPFYYTSESKKLMNKIIKFVLDVIYNENWYMIKKIEIDPNLEEAILIDRDQNIMTTLDLNSISSVSLI